MPLGNLGDSVADGPVDPQPGSSMAAAEVTWSLRPGAHISLRHEGGWK